MSYLGGSAYGMARDVGEGFVLLNINLLRKMSAEELKQLRFEIERILTGIRGEHYPMDDPLAVSTRNRKLSRLSSAVSMINNQILSHR